jgi:hypothetical protein
MSFANARPHQSRADAVVSCACCASCDRTPTLVIPAHAGIHFDPALATGLCESNQARIKSFRSLLRSLRVTFLCLSKEKVTKRKDTPAPRPPGILPSGCVSGEWGLSTALPVLTTDARASMHAPPDGADPPARHRCAGAPLSAILADRSRTPGRVVIVRRRAGLCASGWRRVIATIPTPPHRHPRERGGPVTLVRQSRWVPAFARTTLRMRVSTAMSCLLPGQVWTATRGVPQ